MPAMKHMCIWPTCLNEARRFAVFELELDYPRRTIMMSTWKNLLRGALVCTVLAGPGCASDKDTTSDDSWHMKMQVTVPANSESWRCGLFVAPQREGLFANSVSHKFAGH